MGDLVDLVRVDSLEDNYSLREISINPEDVSSVTDDDRCNLMKEHLTEGKFPSNLNSMHQFSVVNMRNGQTHYVVGDKSSVKTKLKKRNMLFG